MLGWVSSPPLLPPQYQSRSKWEKEGTKVPERTIDTSGQIVLECSGCGEHVILLGHEEDWIREQRDTFECSGCAKTVTLADRVDGTANTIRRLLRSSIRPFNPGP
jgi:ribosomal protein S27AE